jgi:hypothetical protein
MVAKDFYPRLDERPGEPSEQGKLGDERQAMRMSRLIYSWFGECVPEPWSWITRQGEGKK